MATHWRSRPGACVAAEAALKGFRDLATGDSGMLFRWLEPAIRHCEGAKVTSRTFESAYFARNEAALRRAASELGMSPEDQATAFGTYQILGENLARYYGYRSGDVGLFLANQDLQYATARDFFYKQLSRLIKRRGAAWPHYLFSLWNGGVNFVEAYDAKMRRYLGI